MIGELTNHLWQSTIFALVAGLLTVAFRKNRAQVRYWLWFSASVKFFVPFSLLMSLGSYLEWAPATQIATRIAPPSVSFTIEQITQPFPDVLPSVASPRGPAANWAFVVIVGVWGCGFVAIALMRLRVWRRIAAAVRASTLLQIPASVEVRSSPGLLEPGVVGLLRPVLLLPAGIEQRLTPPQLAAVLAHELCHVHRRDNLTAAIHMIAEAVFWFHPLVWWLGARLVEERERACDEEVLRLGNEPQDYAEGILNVCKVYLESPLRCVSGVTGSNLKKRIQAILTESVAADLNLARKIVLSVAGMAVVALPLVVGMMTNAVPIRAQSPMPPATQKFEVASIKACRPGERGGGGGSRGSGGASPGRLNLPCQTVMDLIREAYVFHALGQANLITALLPTLGGPAWINADLYQINAKAEGEASQGMMRGTMLQALMEDQFKLKTHRETREVPVYLLTVSKGGPKLEKFKEGSCISFSPTNPPPQMAPGQEPPRLCGAVLSQLRENGDRTHDTYGITVDQFARLLERTLSRPVINKTGITGMFDFHLEFAPDEATAAQSRPPGFVPSGEPAGPSIFTAVQEQLGLKLESARGPGEFLIIDHIEKPAPN